MKFKMLTENCLSYLAQSAGAVEYTKCISALTFKLSPNKSLMLN